MTRRPYRGPYDFPSENHPALWAARDYRPARSSLPWPTACERFCRLFGIDNELALRLLHKTQSAKNLGDLNTFLRDFMLDKPTTFEAAERLVNEFGELNTAHQAVLTARDQVQTLVPAREQYQKREILQLQRNQLEELQLGIYSFQETLRAKLLEQIIVTLQIETNGLAGEISSRQNMLNNYQATLRDLELQRREMGGDQIEQWEAEKQNLDIQLNQRLRKRSQTEEACQKLNWMLPSTSHGFAELIGKAREETEHWQQQHTNKEQQFSLTHQKQDKEKEFAQVVKEVNALERQPSNIPADMLELRKEIATAIGVTETALPFIGELIEIKSDEFAWQGAIERVLYGFALSLLVDEHHYFAVANYINNTSLGKRIVYYRTIRQDNQTAKSITSQSLIFKLNVKQKTNYTDWLQIELQQRFDYACLDSMQAFKNSERALTREGQIKHNKTRHEKDDRRRIDDRRHWVLGFDNRDKLTLFKNQAQTLAGDITNLTKQLAILVEQEKLLATRAMICQTLVNLQWQEIDIAPLLDRIELLNKQLINAKNHNQPLQKISDKIEEQQQKIQQESNQLREIETDHKIKLKDITRHEKKIYMISIDPAIISLTSQQTDRLKERFDQLAERKTIDHENIQQLGSKVSTQINNEKNQLNLNIHNCEKYVENHFADFKRRWPLDAGDMDATLASSPDYFAKLSRLETDGLPAYEHRFFELLQNQSHQNLAALATLLNQARKAILERMELVNTSLSQAQFNTGTYLHIQASDRQLSEVKEFRQEISEALSYAWNENKEFAESRFTILRQLVNKLSSSDPEWKRWREAVLDVRQHVEFIGREMTADGVEIEVYRSGAGKSGGQRQKLATTCLAAALRYQLGGNDHHVPLYAPVILDEAFDKADNEFTALAMNIFTNFGFQMIVATPLKSVMTLEPFIGGACFVDISDRRVSGVLLIEYNEERSKLDLPDHALAEIAYETT